MDIYQLRYFLTIAETGSFSRAAERLYLSQPSLSAGIKKLEQELGVCLFERGGRRTVLTPAGRAFQAKAMAIMGQYQAALKELKGFYERPILRVGVLSTLRVAELAALVSTFQHHHPHVTIEVHDGTLALLREKLEQGDVDVTLTALADRDDPQLSTALFQQKLLLALPLTHPLAQRASIRLTELDGQPFIDRVNCEFHEQECQILAAADVQPNIIYRASHEEWVIALIQAGLGVSIMPHWQGLSRIAYLPIADVDFQRTVGMKWRQQQTSKLVEQFCHFAASHSWGAG
ncbi:LysR family transcriptional regulator [Halomicronema hongdechloris C2206]|uniref:LysR family transcriptional regulator n=1 Tax=Halomicronema hongdechloris C2206 TaxID=1641165 RepID=A0A1Z3HJT4_9CYAN|nr:LysR family transcriptional regulator [Halomicronema hongdechloris]ASC70553.1 LysR family transcriptional regulator [Halomicronema hongdechloris C2206]